MASIRTTLHAPGSNTFFKRLGTYAANAYIPSDRDGARAMTTWTSHEARAPSRRNTHDARFPFPRCVTDAFHHASAFMGSPRLR